MTFLTARRRAVTRLLFGLAVVAALPALAQEQPFTLVIANHRFEPAELTLPANKRVTLVVKNTDPTPEEFESKDLRVEKVIPGGKEARVTIGPLKPGRYRFVGEYHEATAVGWVVVK